MNYIKRILHSSFLVMWVALIAMPTFASEQETDEVTQITVIQNTHYEGCAYLAEVVLHIEYRYFSQEMGTLKLQSESGNLLAEAEIESGTGSVLVPFTTAQCVNNLQFIFQ